MTTIAPVGNTITVYTDNRHNAFSPAKITPEEVVLDVEIKNPEGKVINSKYFYIDEKLITVSNHPEVPEGGFTRYGNWIKDPLQKFYAGLGLLYLHGSKAEKEMDAKNLEGDPKLRIFDSIQDEKYAREMDKKIKTFFTETIEKFGISKSEAKKALKDALKY